MSRTPEALHAWESCLLRPSSRPPSSMVRSDDARQAQQRMIAPACFVDASVMGVMQCTSEASRQLTASRR